MHDILACCGRTAPARTPAHAGVTLFSRFRKALAACGVAAVATAAASTPARADIVVGVDDPFEPLWHIDTDTGVYTPLLSAFGGQAIANDPETGTLYFMTNTVTLYRWAYAAGGQPQLIGNTTSSTSNPFLSLTGLGYDPVSNRLMATRTLDSDAGPEGLYSVSTSDGFSTLIGQFPGAAADFDVGGYDVDPVTGRTFGFSDRNNRGIFEIDPSDGTLTFLAPPPVTVDDPPDIDGLAAGDGRIYLVEDRAAQAGGRIFIYNVGTGQYEEPLYVPWFFSEVFSGATWIPDDASPLLIPEPSSGILLAAGALLALRRRRGVAARALGSSRGRLPVAARLAVLGALAAPAVLAGSAQAQLVMGTSTRSEPLYLVDLRTIRPGDFPTPANIADSYELPNTVGISIWGLTADEANSRLIYLDVGPLFAGADPTSNLYSYDYLSGNREFLGQIVNRSSGFGQTMQGLALNSAGQLFGVYNVGGTPGEGLYQLDLANPSGFGLNRRIFADPEIFARDLPGGESAYDFGSLDYDPVTDRLYFYNNDDGAPDGRGVYAFNLANDSAEFIVAGPTHRRLENDIGGLAAGDGRIYLTTDEPGFVYIHDLLTGGPYNDFLSPIVNEGGLFAGAGYAPGLLALIPEPSGLGLAFISGLLLLRRRRGQRRGAGAVPWQDSPSCPNSRKGRIMQHLPRTRFLAPAAVSLAALAAASTASAQSYSILLQDGQTIDGVGNVTSITNLTINNLGNTLFWADTDHATTTADFVLLSNGSLLLREDDSVPPAGANLSSVDDFSLDNSGNWTSNYFLRNTGATTNDSGIYYNNGLVLQEGTATVTSGIAAGSVYSGFFGVKTNDNRQIVINSTTRDTADAIRSTLELWALDSGGSVLSRQLLAYEGASLSGVAGVVQSIDTNANEFALNSAGEVLFAGDTDAATTSDGFVYHSTLGALAVEGSASPVAGRTWLSLLSPEMDLNNSGDWVFAGQLSGDTATDRVIIKNGSVFVQEGDAVPGIDGVVFDNLASPQIQMDDAGNILWVGEFNAASTAQDRGLFYNDTLLLQEGVSTIDGALVLTINTLADTLSISDNGQFALVELTLEGNLETVVRISIPEPSSLALLAAAPLALLRRRRR